MNTPHSSLIFASALFVEKDIPSKVILSSALTRAGIASHKYAESGKAALAFLQTNEPDVIFCAARLPDMQAADFIRAVRKLDNWVLRTVPIILVTDIAGRSVVEMARDAGVNLVITKPVTAPLLAERLAWIARGTRAFVHDENYAGPDRRFRYTGLPNGAGRRANDFTGKIGVQTDSNMSHTEIDSFMKPARISL